MVNPQSNLARKHPEWVVKSPGREIYQERNQWVLDLSNPAVQDFVFGIFDGVMKLSKNIDYVKWDCNRVIQSFGSTYLGKEQDRFYVEYCQGLYDVMRRIRAKYPDVMIQCCSSGGGRVDYGALKYFDEIWTSDNTDAAYRASIQYSTNLIYPPFIMGAHVSAVTNHQSGNVAPPAPGASAWNCSRRTSRRRNGRSPNAASLRTTATATWSSPATSTGFLRPLTATITP